jgi:transposase
MRKAYQSDLTDAEWSCLQSYLPAPKANGRPRVYTLREILDAIFFYVLKSGCAWRLLPHDLGRLGRPSITTSDDSAWMVAGRGFTPPCASGSGFASREIPNPARA